MSDNTEIANQFNDHFANITSSVDLGDAPLYPNWDYISEFVASKLPSSAPLFTIPPISEQDVESSLSRLKSNKAVGLDGVDGYFLKIAASAISNSLTTVFNLSISSGVFPDAWKVAKVTPLFKEGSLLDRSNFRPISVLAIVSKILERHVHSNLYDFLTCHDLLTDSQFGFRCFRSCELAYSSSEAPTFEELKKYSKYPVLPRRQKSFLWPSTCYATRCLRHGTDSHFRIHR